ncbi:MAG: transposase [Pseudoflavonifractor sp.]
MRKEHHLAGYDYATPGYYFVTICSQVRGKDIFSSVLSVGTADPGGPRLRLTPLGKIIDDLICGIDSAYRDVHVDQYVIMPDHVHLLIQLGTGDGPPGSAAPTALPRVINALKGFATRKQGASFWQDDYYDHVLRNDFDLAETRDYILQNPLKSLEIKD